MSAPSISQFEWRLVIQQRQIYNCVFRLFDSCKYLTTLRSNISRCQKVPTLTLITLYNPLFHLWRLSKKIFGHYRIFCLGCLLKSVTMTSFSQPHLLCNSCSRRSLDQINLHFLALHTRRLIKKGEKCEKLSRFCVGMENFTFREIHVGEKSKRKFVAFFLLSCITLEIC